MENPTIKRQFVEAWWAERVDARAQIRNTSGETRGPGPWYRTVSIGALYGDFRLWVADTYGERIARTTSQNGFMMIFRDVLPDDTETIYARINTPRGQVRKRCLRFKNVAHYRYNKVAA